MGNKYECTFFSGQNKNNYVISYLAWCVIQGLYESIELNFLVARYTKFTPDLCFGLVEKTFRHTPVSSPDDIAKVFIFCTTFFITSFPGCCNYLLFYQVVESSLKIHW